MRELTRNSNKKKLIKSSNKARKSLSKIRGGANYLKCIDFNISVITNIKCIILFVSSLKRYKNNQISYKSWNDYIN